MGIHTSMNGILAGLLSLAVLMTALLQPRDVAAQEKAASNSTASPQSETTQKEGESGSFWMEQKLRLSQEILVGLASGDFDQIGKSAEVMRGLTKIEAFVRREPKDYRDYLRQFELANEALIRNAVDENLEGAALAFNQLTISCVHCHKQLRESE